MFGLQPTHIILMAFVALLVFGLRLLTDRARGQAVREFRISSRELQKPVQAIVDDARNIGALPK